MQAKILQRRYKLISPLGSGGYGTTFLALDQQQSNSLQCVVKQLTPQVTAPDNLQVARRLFATEARVLQKLGHHSQIPQLLDYFEEAEEFYLVQEFIDGHNLSEELQSGKQLPEREVAKLLREILETLAFVHQQNVIHRDIKPSNLIRRRSDGKLVLIDFGAVKQISTQALSLSEQSCLTVAIGTPGYLPSEQATGKPKFNSDLYAVGMIGIYALTGLNPTRHLFPEDPATGELHWRHLAQVSSELGQVIDRMVRYDFRDRYASAEEVLSDLKRLEDLRDKQSVSPFPSSSHWSENTAPLDSLNSQSQFQDATQAIQTIALSSPSANTRFQVMTLIGTWLNQSSKSRLFKPVLATTIALTGTALFGFSRLLSPPEVGVPAVSATPVALSVELVQEGDRLREAGEYQTAVEAYDRALALDPSLKTAWWGRCYGLNVLQHYEKAINACDRALELAPDYPEALSSKGYALNALRRYEDAIAAYKQALKVQPDYLEAWVNQGATLHQLKRYDEALTAFEQAIVAQPNYPEAWNNKGAVLADLEQFESALQAYNQALELRPNYPEAWNNKGVALDKLQRREEALIAYEQALKLNPDYAMAKENRQRLIKTIKR